MALASGTSGVAQADGIVPPESEITDCKPQIIVATEEVVDLEGSNCDDLIVATEETVAVDAGSGNDVIFGADAVTLIEGGDGEDIIYADGALEVRGGADDDRIFGSSTGAEALNLNGRDPGLFRTRFKNLKVRRAILKRSTAANSYATLIEGNSLNNTLFGGAGNDEIRGYGGSDLLFGNNGDDRIYGGTGDDLVAGGHGADWLEGETGSDWTRGDGTQDSLIETTSPNAGDVDTISFATAVTPGFQSNDPGKINFPTDSGERGVYFKKANSSSSATAADNGIAGNGGGNDLNGQTYTNLSGFEVIVGSPFSDYIVGSDDAETIFGGGGSDVMLGAGGNDILNGGASGDSIDGGAGANTINGDSGLDYCVNGTSFTCNETWTGPTHVVPRDTSKVAVGFMSEVKGNTTDNSFLQLYLLGSTANDSISVTYNDPGGSYNWVEFTLGSGSSFDTSTLQDTQGCDYSNASSSPAIVKCTFQDHRILDSIVVAGMANVDTISATYAFPEYTQLMLLGGAGDDIITSPTNTYDVLVDGVGNDKLYGQGRDDLLINQAGEDELYGGGGDEFFLNTTLCESADLLNGGSSGELNNASWLRIDGTTGVYADLPSGKFGYLDISNFPSDPVCNGSTTSSKIGSISFITNLEGTSFQDKFVGGGNRNSMIGWSGKDILNGKEESDALMGYAPEGLVSNSSDMDSVYGGDGNDRIWVADGFEETLINCGSGDDEGARDVADGGQLNSNCETVDP